MNANDDAKARVHAFMRAFPVESAQYQSQWANVSRRIGAAAEKRRPKAKVFEVHHEMETARRRHPRRQGAGMILHLSLRSICLAALLSIWIAAIVAA